MEQMKAFIEKASSDSDLLAKLNELSKCGEAGKIVALAAEYGFEITEEDCRKAAEKASCAGCAKTQQLTEEDLESVDGGFLGHTLNRYSAKLCGQVTAPVIDCHGGELKFFPCDHFKTWYNYDEKKNYASCAMGRYAVPYSAYNN